MGQNYLNEIINQEISSNEETNKQLKQHFLNNRKKFVVIINPASGAGKAVKVFENKVAPVFKESEIKFEVFLTKNKGSAFDFLKNLDQKTLLNLSGIVVVSGDGLLFEVFNSLMSRDDWKKVIKVPIGVIPGGSGNGLSYSISHAVGDTDNNQIVAAAFNVISGKSSPLDLIKVTCENKIFYSFLSIGWGLISDIDIESESLRLLGGHRFTVWAVVRALGLRRYTGVLKFKPYTGYLKKSHEEFKAAKKNISSKISEDFLKKKKLTLEKHFSNNSDISYNENEQIQLINYIMKKDEYSFQKNLKSSCSVDSNDSIMREIESILNESLIKSENNNNGNRTKDSSIDNENYATNISKVNIENTMLNNGSKNAETMYENENNFVDENDEWITIKDNFVMVYAASTSHLSSNCHFIPGAKLDDGIIWLLYLKGDISRRQVVKFLMSLDNGDHINLPFVNLIPVKEFTLSSEDTSSKFTIDGELISTLNLHATMMPCTARIMTK